MKYTFRRCFRVLCFGFGLLDFGHDFGSNVLKNRWILSRTSMFWNIPFEHFHGILPLDLFVQLYRNACVMN